MIVREIINKIGFKVDDNKLKQADKAVLNFKKHLLLLTAAASAATVSLYALVKTTATFGDMLDKNAEAMGFSVEQYQLLIGAASLSGIEVSGLTTAMLKFNMAVGQAAMGNQMGLRIFNALGIGIRKTNGIVKSNIELLGEVGDKLVAMKSGQAKVAISQLAFGRGGLRMIDMFGHGKKGLKALMDEYKQYTHLLDKNATKASAKFNDQLFLMKTAMTGIKNYIGVSLMPQINDLVKGWLEWFKANKKLALKNVSALVGELVVVVTSLGKAMIVVGKIVQGITKIFGGLSNTLTVIEVLLGVMISTKIITGIIELSKVVFGLAKAFRVLAASESLADLAAAALPAIFLAILAAIVLLVDDIYNFAKGRDSLIGRLIEGIGGAIDSLDNMIKAEIDSVFDYFEKRYHQMVNMILKSPLKLVYKIAEHAVGAGTMPIFATPGTTNEAAFRPGLSTMLAATPGARNNNLVNNTTVNLTAPPGSTEAQQEFLRESAESTFDEIFQRHLQGVVTVYPRIES